ncbi:MAG: peptidoglycan editing factor PgeF [Pseudomonadota bacterium]
MAPPHRTASALQDARPARHGFFGREGGVSSGLYASLNVGYGSNDERASVDENRARCAAVLGAPRHNLITVYQIHSARAVAADAPWSDPPEADAIVTKTPGLAIGVLAADCTPVLMADPKAGVIGAAHAGWKGALSGVLEATIEAMIGLGAQPGAISAAIGPCIRQDSYEVGVDFMDRFVSDDPGSAAYFADGRTPDKRQFDLPGYVGARLTAAGLAVVEDVGACTYRNESRYFSYRRATHRRETDYGRNLSAIVLDP